MSFHKVFVTGATGTQGVAICRQLRALGWDVNATSRNPSSPAAQALSSMGVNVYEGSWSDTAALSTSLAGCDLLFLNIMPDMTNMATESQYGATVLGLAKTAGVQHVVYSSGLVVPPPTDDPNDIVKISGIGKRANEAAVQASGIPYWTVVRPGNFMANYLSPKVEFMYPGSTETGLFVLAFRPDSQLPMIDQDDIATFVIAAFREPEKFHGQMIDLVSENTRVDRSIEVLRTTTGKDIRAKYLTDEEIVEGKKTNRFFEVQEVLRDMKRIEPTDGEKWGVKMNTFEKFALREKKAFDETYRRVGA
ncbi:hypothetical protein N0V88_001511 [Collariella sp. IMI 366227]|nr:hypothetical protein N0V88_001511 [Collariella sp. IMI 366227]